MKLNPDCIRDILLTVEDTTDLNNWLNYPKRRIYLTVLLSKTFRQRGTL